MAEFKFRPGSIVRYIMDNKKLIDCSNEKKCIHFAPNDDGEIELHVQKNSEGMLECDMCHHKIYKRFDQSAIDIVDRCMHVILSSRLIALDFANRLHSTALIARIHIGEFYEARYIIEHEFTFVRTLLKTIIAYVTSNKEHGTTPVETSDEPKPTDDSNEEPETDTNVIQTIEQCISVVDQILIFGLPNGLRENAQDELLIFRSALHDLVEDLENSK